MPSSYSAGSILKGVGKTAVKAAPVITGTILSGRQRPEEKEGLGFLRQQVQYSQNLANQLVPMGTGLVRQGIEAQQPSLNYWQSLLSGQRGAATSAMAPEISRIAEGYEQARRSQAELMPRGGGRSALLSQLPYQQQRDVSTLMQQARPAAAQELTKAGQAMANTGSAAINSAIQGLYASSRAGTDMLDYAARKRQSDIEEGSAIGGALTDIAGGNLPLDVFKKTVPAATGGAGTAGAGVLTSTGSTVGAGPEGATMIPGAIQSSSAAPGVAGSIMPGGALGVVSAIAAPLAFVAIPWMAMEQPHEAANKWVQGYQNPFDRGMAGVDQQVQSGWLSREEAEAQKQRLVQEYLKRMQELTKTNGEISYQAWQTFRQRYPQYIPEAERANTTYPGVSNQAVSLFRRNMPRGFGGTR